LLIILVVFLGVFVVIGIFFRLLPVFFCAVVVGRCSVEYVSVFGSRGFSPCFFLTLLLRCFSCFLVGCVLFSGACLFRVGSSMRIVLPFPFYFGWFLCFFFCVVGLVSGVPSVCGFVGFFLLCFGCFFSRFGFLCCSLLFGVWCFYFVGWLLSLVVVSDGFVIVEFVCVLAFSSC